jgi:hypothetical protein
MAGMAWRIASIRCSVCSRSRHLCLRRKARRPAGGALCNSSSAGHRSSRAHTTSLSSRPNQSSALWEVHLQMIGQAIDLRRFFIHQFAMRVAGAQQVSRGSGRKFSFASKVTSPDWATKDFVFCKVADTVSVPCSKIQTTMSLAQTALPKVLLHLRVLRPSFAPSAPKLNPPKLLPSPPLRSASPSTSPPDRAKTHPALRRTPGVSSDPLSPARHNESLPRPRCNK